jgi:hypothetical protein
VNEIETHPAAAVISTIRKAFVVLSLLCIAATTQLHSEEAAEFACDGVLLPHQVPSSDAGPQSVLQQLTLRYTLWTPRVVDTAETRTVLLTVVADGSPTVVVLLPEGGGAPIPLSPVAPGIFEIALPVADLLEGYRVGTAHRRVGRLQLTDGSTVVHGGALTLNVRDVTIDDAIVTSIAPDIQASAHVVNMRRDQPWLGTDSPIPFDVTQRFYGYYEDDVDFLVLVGNISPISNPFYSPIRNDVDGIGLSRFDFGANAGSPDRLQGLIHFPRAVRFDLSGRTAMHEIAHRWINYLNEVPLLAPGRSHWPISDLAYGMIGFSLPDGAGGSFPFKFRETDEGYLIRRAIPADRYHSLELYLMGLLGPESVDSFTVFINQDQRDQLHDGGILQGPVASLEIGDVIAAVGPRDPYASASPVSFHLATIVMSLGRLLTADEMSFFDAMAARGESRQRHRSERLNTDPPTRSFYHATGGRANLDTRIPPLN